MATSGFDAWCRIMRFQRSPVESSSVAVCVSQAALGASVIPHTSIPGLVDFGVPFTQNGTVVMSEKYDVFRPNREVSDSFKLRPDGYADFVEYHFKHLSPDEPTVEVTRVHVPGIRRAEVDKAVAVYVDQMAKSSGEAFVKKGSNYLSETFDIIVDGTSIDVMVAPAVAQAAEIEALMKRKDYRMRIGGRPWTCACASGSRKRRMGGSTSTAITPRTPRST